MNYLEVFDRGLGNAAVEVEHVGLGVVVPHRRLVVQLDEVVQRVTLPPAQEALLLLSYGNTVVKWQETARDANICAAHGSRLTF